MTEFKLRACWAEAQVCLRTKLRSGNHPRDIAAWTETVKEHFVRNTYVWTFLDSISKMLAELEAKGRFAGLPKELGKQYNVSTLR